MTENKIYSIAEIKDFIVYKTGCSYEEIKEESDIDQDLGCTGDDFHELMIEFSVKFNVSLDNYLWYFHTYEEGHTNNIGRMFFKAPNERVKHIAVTPTVLLQSANAGKWMVLYPEHSIPKRRYDILVNQGLIFLFVLFVIYKCS